LLVQALKWDVLLVACLTANIGMLARHRFFTPAGIDGGGLTQGTSEAQLLQSILQNTLEQAVLALSVHLTYLGGCNASRLASRRSRGCNPICLRPPALLERLRARSTSTSTRFRSHVLPVCGHAAASAGASSLECSHLITNRGGNARHPFDLPVSDRFRSRSGQPTRRSTKVRFRQQLSLRRQTRAAAGCLKPTFDLVIGRTAHAESGCTRPSALRRPTDDTRDARADR